MKKIIAIALVCLLAVSVLTACGNTEKKTRTSQPY